MGKDKQIEIETEIDGIGFALKDAILGVNEAMKRLEDLKNILQEKSLDEF